MQHSHYYTAGNDLQNFPFTF